MSTVNVAYPTASVSELYPRVSPSAHRFCTQNRSLPSAVFPCAENRFGEMFNKTLRFRRSSITFPEGTSRNEHLVYDFFSNCFVLGSETSMNGGGVFGSRLRLHDFWKSDIYNHSQMKIRKSKRCKSVSMFNSTFIYINGNYMPQSYCKARFWKNFGSWEKIL